MYTEQRVFRQAGALGSVLLCWQTDSAVIRLQFLSVQVPRGNSHQVRPSEVTTALDIVTTFTVTTLPRDSNVNKCSRDFVERAFNVAR